MKRILLLFLIPILCFAGVVKTGTFYDPTKEDIGVYYIQKYKDNSNVDGYSFRIVYAMGSNRGECHFYNIKNPKKGILYGTCGYKAYNDVIGTPEGMVFKFEFLDNGNLKVNDEKYPIYKRSNMDEKDTIKQIDFFNSN